MLATFSSSRSTPPAARRPVRLLAPIRRISEIEPALRHAAACDGGASVCFLHVCGDVPHEREGEQAAALLAWAAASSRNLGVAYDSYIMSGEVAQVIVDAAELLDCTRIVVARSASWTQRIFSSGTVRKVQRLSRNVPLVQVDSNGRQA
jgi:nucleotide-binding universal stress UspA family protein